MEVDTGNYEKINDFQLDAINEVLMMMNKYIELVKRAYASGELYLLLAGDNKYIVDSDGKFFLREDIRLTGVAQDECDPMNIEAILSALEDYYCSLDKKSGEKKDFWSTLRQSLENLLSSNDAEKVYFATKIYYSLGKRDGKDSFYPFKGLYGEIRNNVIDALCKTRDGLKEAKIYEGKNQQNGLWDVIRACNEQSLDKVSLEGIA